MRVPGSRRLTPSAGGAGEKSGAAAPGWGGWPTLRTKKPSWVAYPLRSLQRVGCSSLCPSSTTQAELSPTSRFNNLLLNNRSTNRSVFVWDRSPTCPFINLNLLYTTSIIPHDCRNPAPDIPARSILSAPIFPSIHHSLVFRPSFFVLPTLYRLLRTSRAIASFVFNSLRTLVHFLSHQLQPFQHFTSSLVSLCNRLSLFSTLSGLFCKKQGGGGCAKSQLNLIDDAPTASRGLTLPDLANSFIVGDSFQAKCAVCASAAQKGQLNVKKKIRAIQYGVGPIGASIVKLMREKQAIEIIGAIDNDPAKWAATWAKLSGAERCPLGRENFRRCRRCAGPGRRRGDPFHFFRAAKSHGAAAGLPGSRSPAWCPRAKNSRIRIALIRNWPAKLDEAAKDWGVALVGTGVNPDTFGQALVTLAASSQRIEHVSGRRIVDGGKGAGAAAEENRRGHAVDQFRERVREGTIKHVGLPESVAMVADSLNLPWMKLPKPSSRWWLPTACKPNF